MKIKKISFWAGTRSEATTCDCCGRSIQNIYFITTADDNHIRLGTTCFDKQMKSKLDKMARRKVKHSIESLQSWDKLREYWKTVTEEEYYKEHPTDNTVGNTEDIDTFEDYRKWILEEFIPYRVSLAEEEIRKYAKL